MHGSSEKENMTTSLEIILVTELHRRMKAQGVSSEKHIAFVCPVCSTVQSIASLMCAAPEVAGASGGIVPASTLSEEVARKLIGFSCEGRLTNVGPFVPKRRSSKLPKDPCRRGCDWTLGGLFTIHKLEVVTPDGRHHPSFELATPEQAQALEKLSTARAGKLPKSVQPAPEPPAQEAPAPEPERPLDEKWQRLRETRMAGILCEVYGRRFYGSPSESDLVLVVGRQDNERDWRWCALSLDLDVPMARLQEGHAADRIAAQGLAETGPRGAFVTVTEQAKVLNCTRVAGMARALDLRASIMARKLLEMNKEP